MVKKSKKKNSIKSFDYKTYFHISLGAAIAFFIVAIFLLIPFFDGNLVGEATNIRDTKTTRLDNEVSNAELLKYMGENNFLAQFKNCFCGETCDDPEREPLNEEEKDGRAICVDTDKGVNLFTYGETYFIDNDGNIKDKVNDECISMVSGVSGGTVQTSPTLTIGLLEYYCDDLRISSKKTECDCQDGACIEEDELDIGPLGVGSNTEVIDAGDLPVVDNTATVDYPLDDEE